jgi:hypothetical protein
MQKTGDNRGSTSRKAVYDLGRVPLRRCPIAQLAIRVPTPAQEPAISAYGAGMIPAARNGSHAVCQGVCEDRRVSLDVGSVAQLTIRIQTPTFDSAGGSHDTIVETAGSNTDGTASSEPVHEFRCVPLGRCAVAHLTVGVIAPALDAIGVGHGAGVIAPGA